MLNLSKKLTALTLSVLLASGSLLSACGSVEGDADEKPVKADNIKESAAIAIKSVGNTATTVKDMAMGETDKAYSGEIKLELGKSLAASMGVGNIEELCLSSDTKAKNGNFSTTLAFSYGGDEVISGEVIREGETGRIYMGVPKLSDGYLYADESYIETLMQEATAGMAIEAMPSTVDNTAALEAFEDVDFDAMIEEYAQTVKDNLPEGTDAGKTEGEIGGVSYTLDVKKVSLSGQDALNVITAVTQKLKSDETVSKILDEMGDPEAKQDFYEELDGMSEGMSDDDLSGTAEFDIYYQDGSFAGFAFANPDDKSEKVEIFLYVEETACCGKFALPGTDDDVSMTGSAKLEDNATSVSIDVAASDMSMKFAIDDFKIVDEESGAFTGSVDFSVDSGENGSVSVNMESKSTAKKLDLSASVKVNSEKLVDVTVMGSETKASDVKIPDGKLFDISDEAQLEEYGSTIDVEKFQSDLKKTLGDDLYGKMFGGNSFEDERTSDENGYDDDDFNYFDI